LKKTSWTRWKTGNFKRENFIFRGAELWTVKIPLKGLMVVGKYCNSSSPKISNFGPNFSYFCIEAPTPTILSVHIKDRLIFYLRLRHLARHVQKGHIHRCDCLHAKPNLDEIYLLHHSSQERRGALRAVQEPSYVCLWRIQEVQRRFTYQDHHLSRWSRRRPDRAIALCK